MATRKPVRPRRAAKKAARPSKPRSRKSSRAPSAPRARRPAVPAKRRRKRPETLRLRGVTPGLTANDLQRSIDFYVEALGFVVGERWTGENGVLRGVMLKAGRCEFGLSQDDWAKGKDRKKGEGFSLWCETAQYIDALAARVKATGVVLTQEPKDQPWGGRSFSLDDPDGFHVTIHRES